MSLISIAIIATGVFFVATEASAEANENFADSGAIDLAEPLYHEKYYPHGTGPFPGVIVLHTSGGFKTVGHVIQHYIDDGFVAYAPDFFTRYSLTSKIRMQTFTIYRKNIEKELSLIINIMESDIKIDKKNIFAVGYSNGGFWASYLAGKSKVRAGASHYGVWKANFGREFTELYPMKYFSETSSPLLVLHGQQDGTQKLIYAEKAIHQIKKRGAQIETIFYRNAGHAWDRKHTSKKPWKYNEEVTKDSYRKTIEFFAKHMDISD